MAFDLILHSGPIFMADEKADAVGVRCSRIAAVGKSEELLSRRGPYTQLVNLRGRPLVPGFFDAHTHFVNAGLALTYFVDLTQARSLATALELLSQAAKQRKRGWIIGQGWDESRFEVRRYLEREDLDRAVPSQPALAVRVDGHLLVANSPALAHYTGPSEFVDRKRGHLREGGAQALLSLAKPDRETLVEAVAAASRHALSLGITAVGDMADSGDLFLYQEALRRGILKTRVFMYLPVSLLGHLAALGIEKGFGGNLVRIMGVKAFADGSLGARTAALTEPYLDERGAGKLLLGRDELARLWRETEGGGLQLAVHAIGDRAIEEVVAAAELAKVNPKMRHRIEHLELATPGELDRMAKLGLVASMQPNFVANWSGPGKMYVERLGPERDKRIDPHAWVKERDIPLAFGSDGMPMGPLYGIGAVLSPPHPPQRLPLGLALRAYTQGAAYAAFAEEEVGTIAPGKRADLVVLSADPRAASWEDITVDMTFLGGELLYERQTS